MKNIHMLSGVTTNVVCAKKRSISCFKALDTLRFFYLHRNRTFNTRTGNFKIFCTASTIATAYVVIFELYPHSHSQLRHF